MNSYGVSLQHVLNPPTPHWGIIRKVGTIQRRLAWPLHKDDMLFRSGGPQGSQYLFCFDAL
ncbi:hypothetical protein L218DRAFT_860887 [Marasmius fiardii PR-910]|nr:hypothetical protein L218DRAFT_860887 [Marasmius fiardii PR-910]